MSTVNCTYVRQFLDCVAPGETQFIFQAIGDTGARRPHGALVGTLEQHHAQLAADNAQGFGIYWQVNGGASRAYADVTHARCLFLDFDSGGLPALPLTPHCVVQTSPGKFQAYWRVSDCGLDDFDTLMTALVDRWGADPAAKGRNRLFRLPGFLHQKRQPFLSEIHKWSPLTPAYRVADIRASLLAGWVEPPKPSYKATEKDWSDKTPEEQARIVLDLRDALKRIPADARNVWTDVGQALAGMGETGFDLWDEWSQTSAKYAGPDSLLERNVTGDRTGYAAIFIKAKQFDPSYLNPASNEARIAAAVAGFGFGGVMPSVPPGPTPEPPVTRPSIDDQLSTRALTFVAAASGSITANSANIADALLSVEGGSPVAYDEFLGRTVIYGSGTWRVMQDQDVSLLRVSFERRGFKPVSKDAMMTAIGSICASTRFDSAIDWANGLRWDGVPRVTMSLSRYYQTKDTPYTRAAAEYMWTALAGRCMQPGCKADMALILVGLQGARKTSSVAALAPTPLAFGKVNLGKRDEDLSRRLKGKLVVELPELRGLSGRDIQGIRDWMTTQDEAFVDKYDKFETTYPRRCLVIGTSNEDEVLDDAEGERRWLPMRVGSVDIDALTRDRDQLWAEGIAMWRQGGVRWQEAERLARDEHGEFKVGDEWTSLVADWLEQPCSAGGASPASQFSEGRRRDHPVRIVDALAYGIRMPLERINHAAKIRMAKIMTSLNYKCHVRKINGRSEKVYVAEE